MGFGKYMPLFEEYAQENFVSQINEDAQEGSVGGQVEAANVAAAAANAKADETIKNEIENFGDFLLPLENSMSIEEFERVIKGYCITITSSKVYPKEGDTESLIDRGSKNSNKSVSGIFTNMDCTVYEAIGRWVDDKTQIPIVEPSLIVVPNEYPSDEKKQELMDKSFEICVQYDQDGFGVCDKGVYYLFKTKDVSEPTPDGDLGKNHRVYASTKTSEIAYGYTLVGNTSNADDLVGIEFQFGE